MDEESPWPDWTCYCGEETPRKMPASAERPVAEGVVGFENCLEVDLSELLNGSYLCSHPNEGQ